MFPMPLVMVCSVASWLRMYASSEYLFFREEFLSFSRARSQKNKRKGEISSHQCTWKFHVRTKAV